MTLTMEDIERLRAEARERNVPRISFYDHHRQSYGDMPLHGPAHVVAEFMIGNYPPSGGVAEGGEFKIALYALGRWRDEGLSPHLEVFTDGIGTLLRCEEEYGLVSAMEGMHVPGRDEFSRFLIGLGIENRSDNPLPEEGAT